MNYQDTIDYLFQKLPIYQRSGKIAYKADIGNIVESCNILGNPHLNFKSIHVAGTNGKGSTSHIMSSILQEAGYKVGLYTSPHLKDFRERIKINGRMISENSVINFVKEYKLRFEEIQMSFFEMTVAMAFYFFSKEEIDGWVAKLMEAITTHLNLLIQGENNSLMSKISHVMAPSNKADDRLEE